MRKSPDLFSRHSFRLFENFTLPPEKYAVFAATHKLIAENIPAVELIQQSSNVYSSIVISFADTLFSFGHFNQNTITIKEDLSDFETAMVLLFELCNLNNSALTSTLDSILNYENEADYIKAVETAEFESIQRFKKIVLYGLSHNNWKEQMNKIVAMQMMLPLLEMTIKEYLTWARTPQPMLNGKAHTDFFAEQFQYAHHSAQLTNAQ